MLITDFEMFTSDNPDQGFKELHDFAQSIGYDKGWHYNHNNHHYYLCKRKIGVKRALRMHQARIVSKMVMRRIIKGRYDKTFPRDYHIYSIKKRCSKYMKECCAAYGIEIPMKEIYVKSSHASCRCHYWDMYIDIKMVINDENPTGKILLNTNGTEINIPVLDHIKEQIMALDRPIPVGRTIIKK